MMMEKVSSSSYPTNSWPDAADTQPSPANKDGAKDAPGDVGPKKVVGSKLAVRRNAPGVAKKPSDKEEFQAELRAASQMVNPERTPVTQNTTFGKASEMPFQKMEELKEAPRMGGEGRVKAAFAGYVDQTPNSQRASAGMKSADAIAGLKPWGKDWVFEGIDPGDPSVKTLFSSNKQPHAEQRLPSGVMDAKTKAILEKISVEMPSPDQIRELAQMAQASGDVELASALKALSEQQAQGAGQGQMAFATTRGDASGVQMRAAVEGAALRPAMKPVAAPNRGTSELSGAEYLGTLGAVRGAHLREGTAGFSAGSENPDGSERQFGNSHKLRLVEGGFPDKAGGIERDRRNEFGEAMAGVTSAYGHHDHVAHAAAGPMQVDGHVTKGAMARDRLSSQSLIGISTGIRNLAPNGGGEMRVRLKPENLGELHLRVVTSGNHVGLQIQASDERARKILEESLPHLKESLSSQNLHLGKVELVLASGAGHEARGEQQQGQPSFQNHAQSGYMDRAGQDANQGRNGSAYSNREGWAGGDAAPWSAPAAASAAPSGLSSAPARGAYESGRLDVRA